MRSGAVSTNASAARTGRISRGQRYTLLSRRENLSLDGRRALKKLLQANRRLNTAYVLKEAFGATLGLTAPNAGLAPFSHVGKTASNGSACIPTRSSPE